MGCPENLGSSKGIRFFCIRLKRVCKAFARTVVRKLLFERSSQRSVARVLMI
jgi:hypothetical protein